MKWAAAGSAQTMEQLSPAGRAYTSCPLLSSLPGDIESTGGRKKVLTHSEEREERRVPLFVSTLLFSCVKQKFFSAD